MVFDSILITNSCRGKAEEPPSYVYSMVRREGEERQITGAAITYNFKKRELMNVVWNNQDPTRCNILLHSLGARIIAKNSAAISEMLAAHHLDFHLNFRLSAARGELNVRLSASKIDVPLSAQQINAVIDHFILQVRAYFQQKAEDYRQRNEQAAYFEHQRHAHVGAAAMRAGGGHAVPMEF